MILSIFSLSQEVWMFTTSYGTAPSSYSWPPWTHPRLHTIPEYIITYPIILKLILRCCKTPFWLSVTNNEIIMLVFSVHGFSHQKKKMLQLYLFSCCEKLFAPKRYLSQSSETKSPIYFCQESWQVYSITHQKCEM